MAELWHGMNLDEVLDKLNSEISGLTDQEAGKRLSEHGPNELEKPEKMSVFKIFGAQFTNVLAVILLAATILSIFVGEILDAIAILVILIVAAVLGFSQEYRAERAIDALRKMLNPVAKVIRGSEEKEIPARELVPGDVVLLESGDRVPADGRVLQAFQLQVNEASLTGESVPVWKQNVALENEVSISEMNNMIFAGTTITDGKGKAVVVATGAETEFGKIAKEVTTVEKTETPLERRMKDVGKLLSKLMLGACLLVVVVGIVQEHFLHNGIGLDFVMEMVLFGVALAVAAVPEALPAIVTGTLAIGMREMAKRNAIVRKMPAVETLGSTSVICTDKTGTLTRGEMTVRRIHSNNRSTELTGVGFNPTGEFLVDNQRINPLEDQSLALVLTGASLCNEARLVENEGVWQIIGDPTEGALIVAAAKAGLDQREIYKRYPRIDEIPFSSERKRMTTVHREPAGEISVFMKGAPEVVLDYCERILEKGREEPLSKEKKKQILGINEKMSSSALRVLGIAYKISEDRSEEIEKSLTFLGLMGMIDPPREEAAQAIDTCKRVKMKPVMITGDQKLTALAIAEEMGIYKEGDVALDGRELETLSDEELSAVVDRVTVYARVSPFHKLRIVKAWKEKGEVVAMTGDGVNDAPALKEADIGIAMGITGTEVTKEASDMVITDDNFATIVKAVERGRWIYDNIKKYVMFLLQCNIVELIVLGTGVLLGLPLALLPAQILYINLATDGLPAIALGVGPADPDIMKRPPRNPKEGIFTRDSKLFLTIFPALVGALILWFFVTSLAHGETFARTRVFLIFVIFELAIALSLRSLRHSVIKAKPHRLLLLAVFITAIQTAILVAIPSARQALRIGLPSMVDIGIILVLCAIIVAAIEMLKRVLNKI